MLLVKDTVCKQEEKKAKDEEKRRTDATGGLGTVTGGIKPRGLRSTTICCHLRITTLAPLLCPQESLSSICSICLYCSILITNGLSTIPLWSCVGGDDSCIRSHKAFNVVCPSPQPCADGAD